MPSDTYTVLTSQWCSDTSTGEVSGILTTYCSKTHKVISREIVIVKKGNGQDESR